MTRLDHLSTVKADRAFYTAHPELHGRKLTAMPEDAALRTEWLKLYGKTAAAKTKAPRPKVIPKVIAKTRPPSGAVQMCPYAKAKQQLALIAPFAPIGNSIAGTTPVAATEMGLKPDDFVDIVKTAADAGANYLTAQEAYLKWLKFGLTPETSEQIAKFAVEESPNLKLLEGADAAAAVFLSAYLSTNAVMETDYTKKVAASSLALGTSLSLGAGLVAGQVALWGLPVIFALAGITAPAWVVPVAAVLIGAGVAFGVKKVWDVWGAPKFQKTYMS